ncbi:MAG: hypothetical protein IJU57_05060 [Clostridia bacterium]|nr:hypothetical protein [Clostridia bacterium]
MEKNGTGLRFRPDELVTAAGMASDTRRNTGDPGNTARLFFERKKLPSKLVHAAAAEAAVYGAEGSDDSASTDVAKAAAEQSLIIAGTVRRSADSGRAEEKADRPSQSGGYSSNPASKQQQKRNIKREYADQRKGKSASKAAKTSEKTAKAAKKSEAAESAAGSGPGKKLIIVLLCVFGVLVFLLTGVASCSLIGEGLASTVNITTYPVSDSDMQDAEQAYLGMEAALRREILFYEDTHSYDEYHYDLGDIGHDPYSLISALTAMNEGEWEIEDVSGELKTLFDSQYVLTESVTREIRNRDEQRTDYYQAYDPASQTYYTIPYTYTVRVPYYYYICNVTLKAKDLSDVAEQILDDDQYAMYEIYTATQGNRPDLFPDQ